MKSRWNTKEVVDRFRRSNRPRKHLEVETYELVAHLLADGPAIGRFMDLGCGAAAGAIHVLEQFPQARAVLVDFTPEMLQAAREELGSGAASHVLIQADFSEPGWDRDVRAETPLDAIVSRFAIHHLPDARKRALYAELLDMLAPGGWFLNTEWVASATPAVADLHDRYWAAKFFPGSDWRKEGKSLEEMIEMFANRPDRKENCLTPAETQCGWLGEIGYQDVDIYFKCFELAVFGGRKPA